MVREIRRGEKREMRIGSVDADVTSSRRPGELPQRLSGRARIVATLAEHGTLSRAELSRRTALAASTVSALVTELIDEGVISELTGSTAAVGERGGRPAVLLTLSAEAGVAVGIDFGKSHVRVAVADLGHNLLAELTEPVALDRPSSKVIATATDLVDRAIAEAGVPRDRVIGVGMGLPGPFHAVTGQFGDSTILPGWVGVDAARSVSEALSLPVRVENDANLGALSEWRWGAGRGCGDMTYVKMATGIGAGLIIRGQAYRGFGGTAGELGHTVIDPTGPICRCGNRGCLEMLTGSPSVLEALRPTHGSDLTVEQAIELAHGGDVGCRRAIADAGQAVGAALATLCNLLNPERVVVGGELGAAGELLLPSLREALRRGTIRSAADDVQVVAGELGPRAEVLGALALAITSSSVSR